MPGKPDTSTKTNLSGPRHERPAWVDDGVVYEVFVRNFTPEGTFQAMVPRLGELRKLGATMLWLMPIHPVGVKKRKGAFGSPYAVRDYYAVNPKYGTDDDFRALVEAAHGHGLKLIIDLVANHTAWDHAWIKEHPDWYVHDKKGKITPPPKTDWSDVAGLDYAAPELRSEMKRVMRYWIETFDIDGYRCDVAEMIPAAFWQEAIPEIRKPKPIVLLAEGAKPELHALGFDLTYSWWSYHELKKVWKGGPATVFVKEFIREQAHYPEGAQLLRFTTNHDETAWDETPISLFDGLHGAKAAAVVMNTLPGVPLIYNGQEVGCDVKLGLFDQTPIDWSQNPPMRRFYEALAALRADSAALRHGTVEFLPHKASDDVLLYTRTLGAEHVLVAVNTRSLHGRITLPDAYASTAWGGFFGTDRPDGTTLSLVPYGVAVLRTDA